MDVALTEVFSEITEIFRYLDKSLLEKIPEDIKNNIISSRNKDYIFKYDKTKDLSEQLIKEETKDLLSMLYLEYCCDDDRKKQLIEICKENDRLFEEKYSVENLFKNSKISHELEYPKLEKNEMMVVNNESIFTKLIKKIKALFGRKEL